MFGNPVEFPDTRNVGANSLLGNRISVPAGSTLSHFGLILKEGSANVVMALYTDSATGPRNLVALTPITAVSPGRNEMTMTPFPLAAGNYWLMAVYDGAVGVGLSRSDTTAVARTSPVGFSASLPSPLSFSQQSSGQRYNYYVRMLP